MLRLLCRTSIRGSLLTDFGLQNAEIVELRERIQQLNAVNNGESEDLEDTSQTTSVDSY